MPLSACYGLPTDNAGSQFLEGDATDDFVLPFLVVMVALSTGLKVDLTINLLP